MGTATRVPARGRYLAWEAGQLAGVSGNTLGQWARRHYVKSSVSSGTPHLYSYQDVAEAMVVHELLDRGVSHRDVHQAIAQLGEYGDWPLAEAPLATISGGGGTARVVVRRGKAAYEVGDRGWQQVVEVGNLEAIRTQLNRGGWAARLHPELRHIEVDPERLGGRPTIRGRRIAVEDVVGLGSVPGGVEELVEGYELTREEIADARRWWRAVELLEAA